MILRKERGFEIENKSSKRVRETIAATSHADTSKHYKPYTFPSLDRKGNPGYAIVERSYFERYSNLRIKTNLMQDPTSFNIENLLETFERNHEIPARTEAAFLHALIANAENGQILSKRKSDQIGRAIRSAFLDGVRTVAHTPDEKISVFLPFTERFAQSNRAKIIQVQTNDTLPTEKVIQQAYSVTRIPEVMDALHCISDHALTLQEGSDAKGNYVIITNALGNTYRVNFSTHEKTEKAPVRPVETADGAFDSEIAKAYAESRHGIDAVLLDPYLNRTLEQFALNAIVADIGIGAGPVAIEAIKKGAKKVYGLDNSPKMIAQAQIAIEEAGIAPQNIDITVGSADHLFDPLDNDKFKNNSANLVLSVNVGCTLTSDVFVPHFSEMARIATLDGNIFVTAPTTFAEVFTSGKKTKREVLEDIGTKLLEVNAQTASADNDTKIQTLRKIFNTVGEINRATFVQRNGKFVLVYDGADVPDILTNNDLIIREAELVVGEPIERKLAGSGAEKSTGLVVPNYYHPRSEYLEAILKAGLTIENGEPIHKVLSQEELNSYNANLSADRRLGEEYLRYSPFDIYLLKK